jgi:mannose-6-phosphate isomerase-like protein (cupin superfamily)
LDKEGMMNLASIPSEYGHRNSVLKKKLIDVSENPGRIATMNFAWLGKDMKLEPHKHSDGYEYYFFLEGEGLMLLNNEAINVRKNDFIKVELGMLHSLENHISNRLTFITIRTIV